MTKRIVKMILCAALVFIMAGCASAPKPETAYSANYLAVVSKANPIQKGFTDAFEFVTVDTVYAGERADVEKRAYEAYLNLKESLLKQGIEIGIDSAYRSVEYQEQIVREFTEKYGEEYTRQTVAVPGTSEHHTGLAIDIVPKVNGEWVVENEDMLALSDVFEKIHRELPKHGFILRFLKGKEDVTGYAYEPWHIRYVGSRKIAEEISEKGITLEEYTAKNTAGLPEGFVYLSEAVPDAILEIRYYSTFNFAGERITGYENPIAILSKEAADALKAVSDDVKEQGYRLKIYDAYRPQMAVTHFMNWAKDTADTKMKQYFYPNLDKSVLFAQGYIAEKSGHSRGSTVDLTLFDMNLQKEVDMGGTFDWFGIESHPDWCGNAETGEYSGEFSGGEKISAEQFQNRMILRNAMIRHGFKPLEEEWWHFTLKDEPYPETYFDFPVK
ncbi:MAG: D-alanyl-D-alanine carboxypeptidase family protein [Spirochaetaceae bacterium]|nr:D-alanyl-D-alanine carboxypeptidase family protein [Spirochaetaceae bacterium]